MKKIVSLCTALFIYCMFFSSPVVFAQKQEPKKLPVNQPEQVTFEPDPVLYTHVSRDGKWLVYTSSRDNFTDLWIRSADPDVVFLPERLTSDPADESYPVFSPDARYVAYVGYGYDTKGDIYVIDRKNLKNGPQRLTSRDTEDGAPSFSSDGKNIYYHRSYISTGKRELAVINLKTKESQAFDVQGDGSFPSVSPDGSYIAFVTHRIDQGGDIWVVNTRSGRVFPATVGTPIDIFPSWSPDGCYIYFSRFGIDTNRDKVITPEDNSIIYRTAINENHREYAFPVTGFSYSAIAPQPVGDRVFFLSSQSGVTNLWSLPYEGYIPLMPNAQEQIKLAEEISNLLPPNPALTLLGYYKIVEKFSNDQALAIQSAYKIGRVYLKIGARDNADKLFRLISNDYSEFLPESALSLIEQALITSQTKLDNAYLPEEKQVIIDNTFDKLDTISKTYQDQPLIQARILVEKARLLKDYGKDSASLVKALELLDQVLKNYSTQREYAAEAGVLRADIFSHTGQADEVYRAYIAVIDRFEDVDQWADVAVERIIELSEKELTTDKRADKIELLRDIATKNKEKYPRLSMKALNRIGDIYFADNEWAQARAAYRQVLNQFPVVATQTAAARLALAEISYREERFSQALSLYEEETKVRPYEDRIYQLARTGYIRKSIAAGESLYANGEVPAARTIFKNLIDYDYTIVEAHRGYIKCAAAQNNLLPVRETYQNQLKENPDDAYILYAMGLCLTYNNDKKSLKKAESLIEKALSKKGQIEYFHQTMGYIFEILETVHTEGGNLEKAVEAYEKAYFLNDHENNPINAANLLLNIGNGYFLLGQYTRAFHYYQKRAESKIPFDNTDTEILFYRRFAMSAFQAGDFGTTIETFTQALELVDERIDPIQASKIFDRQGRFVMDQALTPAMKERGAKENSRELALKQSAINARIYKLTQMDDVMPPSMGWNIYKNGIKGLLNEQIELNKKVIPLTSALPPGNVKPEEAEQTLAFLAIRVEKALEYPTRLLTMKAELTDRLGLAYQEAEQWDQAIENFEKAYSLNDRLSLNQNLAQNRRSVAYCTYMKAGTLSGREKEDTLRKSAEDFEKVIDLVNQYGVETKKKEDKTFYLLKIKQSLDKRDETEAAYGFTAEQEIRLARAFLSRIQTELGHLNRAQEEIENQLVPYSSDKTIPESDVYGVSLLYHRAGHLAAARKQYVQAFDRFHHSFTLSISQKNAISSSLNVTNMAHILCRVSPQEQELPRLVRALKQAQQELSPVLNKFPALANNPVPAHYYNNMGVYALCRPVPVNKESKLERASHNVYALQESGKFFSHAMKWLEDNIFNKKGTLTIERKHFALMSTIHLNMFDIAYSLGEGEEARSHLEKALSLSQQGMLPHYEWRALAKLGRYEEALTALNSVTILNARCGPQEITHAFAPLVYEKIKAGNEEEAFNLAEKLSELERINRMAPLYDLELTHENRILFKNVYPRVERIVILREKIHHAPNPEEADYLKTSLKNEQDLLNAKLGDLKAKLPTFAPLMSNNQEQNRFILLIGLAQALDDKADSIVKTGGTKSVLQQEYDNMVQTYSTVKEDFIMSAQEKMSVVPLIMAQPIEAIDVMDILPLNGMMVRLFPVNAEEGDFAAFKVTRDSIGVSFVNSHELSRFNNGPIYVAYENLLELPFNSPTTESATYALSGTHLYRSILNRKPFKGRLLVLPHSDKEIENYTKVPINRDADDKEILEALPRVHTLVVGNEISLTGTVPSRAGKRSEPVLSMKRMGGQTMNVTHMSGHLLNLSLGLMAGTYVNDAYFVGHIFSLFGSPTLVLSRHPDKGSDFTSLFLRAYASQSALEAFNQALAQTGGHTSQSDILSASGAPVHQLTGSPSEGWLQLGYQGMTPEEARVFAREHFEKYVKNAQQAFNEGNYDKALLLFENSLFIAQQDAMFSQYLPDIYRFCRESAYKSGQTETALFYGRSYADMMEKQAPDSQAHAEALFLIGLLHAKLEQYDKSVAVLSEVREMMAGLDIVPGEITVLSNLGAVFENATEYDRALVQFEKAAQLSKTIEKDELVARQYVSIGRIYDLRLSQYAKAKENYRKALDLYREFGTPSEIAESLLNVGRCNRLLGNFAGADRLYNEALSLIQNEPGSERIKVKIMLEQANNAWFQGQYQEAFNLDKKSYDTARTNGWALERVMSLNTNGLIWWTLGDNKRALRRLEDALTLAESLEARLDEVATTLNNIGIIYREMGQYDRAVETFDRALAIDEKLKSRWAIAYDLRNKGLTLLRMKEPEKAIPLFEKAITETRAIGNRINEAKSLLALGMAYKDQGQNQEATTTLEQALDLSRSMALRETQWRCLYELSLISLKQGDKETARELLTQAVDVIEDMRADIKIDQLKNGFVINKMAVYETLVSILIDLGQTTEAFDVAERSRARNFIDLLGNQRLNLRSNIDQQIYDRERALKARMNEQEKLLAQATEEKERQIYKKELDRLNDDHRDLLLEIQAKNPELASLISVDPLKLNDIQSLLDSDAALVVYYVVPDEIISWVIKKNGMKLHRTALGRTTFDEAIMEYRRLTQNLEPLELQSQKLFNWLLADKIPELAQIRYVGIVPHGKLHYMSFATLFDGNSYFIDKHPLFYLPSASLLNYTLKRRVSDKMTGVLAIGNPTLKEPGLDLPFAEREVGSIKWNFPDITTLTGKKATETWVVDNIEKFGIIHLASHGEFDPVNPLFSSIKLAGDGSKDGDLDAIEVFELKINADLVVLSACQTGLGKVTEADEVIGLNRSFFYAGTHAIISSLWRVSDTSTALLIKHFYRQYVQNNKAESLRSAMLHVKNQYPHPGYWGAFTLVGDYY